MINVGRYISPYIGPPPPSPRFDSPTPFPLVPYGANHKTAFAQVKNIAHIYHTVRVQDLAQTLKTINVLCTTGWISAPTTKTGTSSIHYYAIQLHVVCVVPYSRRAHVAHKYQVQQYPSIKYKQWQGSFCGNPLPIAGGIDPSVVIPFLPPSLSHVLLIFAPSEPTLPLAWRFNLFMTTLRYHNDVIAGNVPVFTQMPGTAKTPNRTYLSLALD